MPWSIAAPTARGSTSIPGGPRWGSRAGAWPSSTSPAASSRCPPRTRASPSSTTARSSTRRSCAGSSKAAATASAPAATPRWCCAATRSGDRRCWTGSTGCGPSRYGTARSGASSSPGTAWASSRSCTPGAAATSSSPPRSRPCSRRDGSPASSTRRRCRTISPRSWSRSRTRSSAACAASPPAITSRWTRRARARRGTGTAPSRRSRTPAAPPTVKRCASCWKMRSAVASSPTFPSARSSREASTRGW